MRLSIFIHNVQNTKNNIRNTKYDIWNTTYKIRATQCPVGYPVIHKFNHKPKIVHLSDVLLAKEHTWLLNELKHLQWDFQWDFQTKWANHNKANFGQKTDFQLFAETSLPFCNLEVKIRIEFLAMQNCESRNCQFSGKSRNIQNCFWRPSSRFTSLLEFQWPWTFCCRQKFETCMKQMFSKHLKSFNISHVSPKLKINFHCSIQSWDGLLRSKSPGFVFSPSQRGNWIWN